MADAKRKGAAAKGSGKPPAQHKTKEKPTKETRPADGYPFERDLQRIQGGKVKQSFGNAAIILARHPLWKGLWAFDEFVGDVVTTRPPEWPKTMAPAAATGATLGEWTESDVARLRAWLDMEFGVDLGTGTVGEVVKLVAEKKRIHAVRDYLSAFRWDKKPRLDVWLTKVGGARDDEYTRAVAAKFLIGAVARVMRPGCKNDCMPVFEGEQGLGKSQMLEILFGTDWFSGTPIKMGSKDGYQALRRKWGIEIPELSHFDRSEMNDIKAFLSSPTDRYRPSFARQTTDFARQSVCAGTTNDDDYHKDTTGGRRFWPIKFTKRLELAWLRQQRDQLWAEAVVRYGRGETWYLEHDTVAAGVAAQEIEDRRQVDPWEAAVAAWMDSDDKGTKGGKAYNKGPRRPSLEFVGVSTKDILDVIDVPLKDRTRAHEMRAGAVLRALGWQRRDRGSYENREGDRYRYFPKTGPQGEKLGKSDRANGSFPHPPTSTGTFSRIPAGTVVPLRPGTKNNRGNK